MATNSDQLAALGTAAIDEAGGNLDEATIHMALALEDKPDLTNTLIRLYLEWLHGQTALKPANEAHSRRRTGTHRKTQRERTQAQKDAALAVQATHARAAAWDRRVRGGRRLGSLHFRELDAIIAESSNMAASFLGRGIEDAIDACLLRRIKQHVGSPDPDMLLQDAVKDALVTTMLRESAAEAAASIAQTAALFAKRLNGDAPHLGA